MPRVNGFFDGEAKLFRCGNGVTLISIEDLYEDWKDWMVSHEGLRYLPMFEVDGRRPTSSGFTGSYFTIVNNWKIQPHAANHRLQFLGNVDSTDGSDFTVAVQGYTIHIQSTRSDLAQGIALEGGNIDASALSASVWGYSPRTLTSAGSGGATLSEIEGSTILAKQSTLASLNARLSEVRVSKLDRNLAEKEDIVSPSAIAFSVQNSLEANFSELLEAISSGQITEQLEGRLLETWENVRLLKKLRGLTPGVSVSAKRPGQTPGYLQTSDGAVDLTILREGDVETIG